MNEGFFSSQQIKTFAKTKVLPPRLKMEFPPSEAVKPKPFPSIDFQNNPPMILDIECYPNYFLAKFLRVEDGYIQNFERTKYEQFDHRLVKMLLDKYEIITFNGNSFDIPILRLAMTGATNEELKEACDELIKSELAVWKFEKKYNLPSINIKHVDLIELPKGIVSLKIYGGRLNCDKIQDLPYEESRVLVDKEMDEVSEYCGNDLDLTELIFLDLHPQIELRRAMSEKYKMDLLSKSDAQIAEAVIKSEIERITKEPIEKPSISKHPFLYKAPNFIQFTNPKLIEALEIVETKPFEIDNGGRPSMPEELKKLSVKIGSSIYNLGMGGLHSTEKAAFHVSDDKYTIWDWDVASYYPSIILNCGLYPKQFGENFLTVYRGIVEERLEAKRSGNKVKAESLKITINGSFGKFGSPYSVLYSPNLMVQVTVTGQLSLLMLIDNMESSGIPVVSGNTDGIVVKCPEGKEELMRAIIKRWERKTDFVMESTKYAGIFSRDVNNYIAIKDDGSIKTKGCFALPGIDSKAFRIDKNPENEICSIAMIEYLKYGTPFEETIRNCKDITKFVTLRSVKGGAVWNGQYIGKAVRWYHAKGEKGSIRYRINNNLVPMTEGAKPIMDIAIPFPNDIDYDWYEIKCKELF